MRTKYISLAMLATVFAASCSNEEVVETNADPIGEAIDFRPSVASQTRAAVTTIHTLGNFNVYAKGIHVNSGSLFTPFLIGDNTTRKPGIAKKGTVTDNSGKWTLTNNVYWPSDIEKALFWAFSDLHDKENEEEIYNNGLCVSGVVKFDDATGPSIENYTPTKEDLTKEVINDQGWYDGDNQRDLVSAFCLQTKDPHVSLGFHHLLSQIEVTASSKRLSNDKNNSRIVTVKGAWVVNVSPRGTLTAGFNYDKDNQTASDSPSWSPVTDKQSYGTYYVGDREVPVIVKDSETMPLNILGINGRGNLMLIPQKVESWNGTDETTSGAYLLLLCRVELQHTGTVSIEPGEPIYQPDDGTGYHYHQLFPIIDDYDKTAYGLTAIPIPVHWEIGKKYTYNLNMCGENTGAGKYPPNVPTNVSDLENYLKKFIPGTAGTDYEINKKASESSESKTNIITTIPEKKGVGDYVLDDAIDFTVKVSDWTDGDTWVNGNESNTNTVSE